MRWLLSAVVTCAAIGLSAIATGPANAEPTPAPAPSPTTSTSDELADMVMDAIQQGEPVMPTTTPVPPPY